MSFNSIGNASWWADWFTILGLPSIILGWYQVYLIFADGRAGASMLKTTGLVLAFGIPTVLWLIYIASYFGLIGQGIKEVRNKTFINETVPLDGYSYVNCRFQHVTFKYEGKGLPVRLSHNVIVPPLALDVSGSEQLSVFVTLLRKFNLLNGNFPLIANNEVDVEMSEPGIRASEPATQQGQGEEGRR